MGLDVFPFSEGMGLRRHPRALDFSGQKWSPELSVVKFQRWRDPKRKGFSGWALGRTLRPRLGFGRMKKRTGLSRWGTTWAKPWKVLEPGIRGLRASPAPL